MKEIYMCKKNKGFRLIYDGEVKIIGIILNIFEMGVSRFLSHCGRKTIKIRIQKYSNGIKNKGFNQVENGWIDSSLVYVCKNCGKMHEKDDWDYGTNRMSNTVSHFRKDILDFVRILKRVGKR